MMKQDIDRDLNIILCFSRVVVEKFKNFEGQQKIRLSYKKKEYTLVTIDLSLNDAKCLAAAKDPGSSSHGRFLFIALHRVKYS